MFFKLGFLKNFANFIGKHFQHRCFPMKFAKFQETLLYRTPLMAASENSIIDIRQVSAEAAVRRCSSKVVLLKILQYSQKNTSVGDSF